MTRTRPSPSLRCAPRHSGTGAGNPGPDRVRVPGADHQPHRPVRLGRVRDSRIGRDLEHRPRHRRFRSGPGSPDTRSTLTVVAGKFGYADQSTSVTARRLEAEAGPGDRSGHPNRPWLDGRDHQLRRRLRLGVTVGPAGSATIETDAGRKIVTVVGLDDGQSTTATVTSSRTGYADGVVQTTDAALGRRCTRPSRR